MDTAVVGAIGAAISAVVAPFVPVLLARVKRNAQEVESTEERLELAVAYIAEMREAWFRGDRTPPPLPPGLRPGPATADEAAPAGPRHGRPADLERG